MKRISNMLIYVALVVIVSACSKEEPIVSQPALTQDQKLPSVENKEPISLDMGVIEKSITLNGPELLPRRISRSRADMTTEDFVTKVKGGSVVFKLEQGVYVNFRAADIPNLNPAGHAVTLWMVFFKGDLADGFYSMYRVDGRVIRQNGRVWFGGYVMVGQQEDLWFGDPLEDTNFKNVILVAKTHGIANSSILESQLTTLNGGCEGDPDDNGPIPPCYEFLFSVHMYE